MTRTSIASDILPDSCTSSIACISFFFYLKIINYYTFTLVIQKLWCHILIHFKFIVFFLFFHICYNLCLLSSRVAEYEYNNVLLLFILFYYIYFSQSISSAIYWLCISNVVVSCDLCCFVGIRYSGEHCIKSRSLSCHTMFYKLIK